MHQGPARGQGAFELDQPRPRLRRGRSRNLSAAILDETRASPPSWTTSGHFRRRVSHLGLFNSLSQTLLKLASPGVPDTYQGTELWDFSLVDPDNRRPVDYPRRADLLHQVQSSIAASNGDMRELCSDLVACKEDGRLKLFVHFQALRLRREHPGLMSAGDYLPVTCSGIHQERVFAFVRHMRDISVLVAVPRLMTKLIPDANQKPLGEATWGDTRLSLPSDVTKHRWRNIFSGESNLTIEDDGHQSIGAADVFAHCPVALLVSEKN